MTMLEIALNDLACSGCIGKIKREMKKFPGVNKIKILTGSGKLLINYDEKILKVEEIDRNLRKVALRIFD